MTESRLQVFSQLTLTLRARTQRDWFFTVEKYWQTYQILIKVLENPRSQGLRMHPCPLARAERLEACRTRRCRLWEDLGPAKVSRGKWQSHRSWTSKQLSLG